MEPGLPGREVEALRAWAGARVPLRLCDELDEDWLAELVRTSSPAVALPACRVDLRRGTVEREGEVSTLTDTEGLLLAWMVNQAGSLVTRGDLLEQVWGYKRTMQTRVVDVTIGRLRAKIEADPTNPECLITVRGKGYRLDGVQRETLQMPPPRPAQSASVAGPADDLLGRAEAWAELAHWRSGGGLLTLLGPPGVGKTRIARDFSESTPGAVWCDLLQAGSAAEVAAVVATALGLGASADESAVREGLLHGGTPLVVLDNAEHVLEPVRALLPSRPASAVLVTSRVRLGVSAERCLTLEPLGPEDAQTLLLRRARALRADFEATGETLADLTELTDGLPLALELAAAQARVLSARDLVRVLRTRTVSDRSNPAHHRSYDEALSSSWGLLDDAGRESLSVLAHLRGDVPYTLADELFEDALDTLGGLGDASLVQVHALSGGTVFRLLDTVRRFVLQHCEWSDADALGLAQRVLEHVESLDRSAREPGGWESVRRLHQLRLLVMDVASQALAAGNDEVATGLTLALAHALEVHGADRATLEALDRVRGLGTEEQQRRLCLMAFLVENRPDRERARELDIQRARALSTTPAHEADWVYADLVGRLRFEPGDRGALAAALPDFDRIDGQINARIALGASARATQDFDEARRWLDEALALADRSQLEFCQAAAEGLVATIDYSQGELRRAARLAIRVAETYARWGVGDRATTFRGVYGMALHAAGELEEARRVMEAQIEDLRSAARPTIRVRMTARLGDVLLDLGLPDDALDCARETRRLALQIGDHPSAVQGALVEAAAWLAKEQPDRALALAVEHVAFDYHGIQQRAVLLTVFALLGLDRASEAREVVLEADLPPAVLQIVEGLIAVCQGEQPIAPTADSGADFTRALAALVGGPAHEPRLPRGRCLLEGRPGPYPEAPLIAGLFERGLLPLDGGAGV